LAKFITKALYRQAVLKTALVSLAGLLAFLIPAAGVSSTTAFPGRNGTILAASGSRLYSISVDGRHKRAVGGVRVLKAYDAAEAAWSPDGTRIAFAGSGGGIFVADAAGRHIRRITRTGKAPAWSPDATRILFEYKGWLYLVGADARSPKRLFRGRDPQWSPDGTQLAFEALENSLSNIYVGSLDGTRRLRLTEAWSGECGPSVPGEFVYSNPEWAPDTRRIAYVLWESCGRDNHASILATAPDGSNGEYLVEPDGNPESGAYAPVWAPDGSAIAYIDDDGEGAGWGLSVLTFGGRPRTIAKLVPFAWRPRCNIGGDPASDRLHGTPGPS
jgi:Tol biopolymer transport system component